MTRFRFLDGWRRKSGSNCLKTEEEPHKLIVAFNLPTRHAIFILMSSTSHKILFIKKPTTHGNVKKMKLPPDPPTHLILEQPLSFSCDCCHCKKKLMAQGCTLRVPVLYQSHLSTWTNSIIIRKF